MFENKSVTIIQKPSKLRGLLSWDLVSFQNLVMILSSYLGSDWTPNRISCLFYFLQYLPLSFETLVTSPGKVLMHTARILKQISCEIHNSHLIVPWPTRFAVDLSEEILKIACFTVLARILSSEILV